MSTNFSWEMRPTVGGIDFGPELNDLLPPLVRKLLAQRGISGKAQAEKFLYPRLADLEDPFCLAEMDCAVARIFEAIDAEQEICIYGDYDVDGVGSVTLLRAILRAYGAAPRFFIPIRTQEGYGLSEAGLARCMKEGPRPDLLITVDCGTSSVEEIDTLQNMGVDVIVLDHHEAGPLGRPNAVAVINAKLEHESPFTYLCSAGVVFKLAHALLKERKIAGFDLRHYLDIVAIATVADIVPLVAENRLLTRFGLKVLGEGRNIGLLALNEIAGMNRTPNATHVSFRIGPRINAAGRMDSPLDAVELLITQDSSRARALAARLDTHNKARQAEEEKIRMEAIDMLHRHFDPVNDHVIVLGSRSWHPGVVGIVASLLMRRYHKPTFIISLDDQGSGKGSGRSIPGVSLVQAIHHCSDYLESGGGHDMAAGLVIREENIAAFRTVFNRFVQETTSEKQRKPVLHIDAEVAFPELTLDLLDSYELLEPFGNTNPQPVFMSRGITLTDVPKRLQGNHLRLFMKQGVTEHDAIYFNGGEMRMPDPPWDIAFTITRNVWRGRSSLSISIQDIRSAEP